MAPAVITKLSFSLLSTLIKRLILLPNFSESSQGKPIKYEAWHFEEVHIKKIGKAVNSSTKITLK